VGVSRAFFELHSHSAARVRDAAVERKFGLRFVGRKLAPFRTVSLEALVQLAAPLVLGKRVQRQISLRCGLIPNGDGLRRVTEVA